MRFFSRPFRRKPDGLPPWAALDQESLRISAAMEHVQDHGNLDAFPGNQNEKLALILTASRQGLVTWNRNRERYELTSLGRQRLGIRRGLQESGGQTNPLPAPPSAVPAARHALGSGTIMAGIAGLAIGAAAMALLPGSSSDIPPRDRAAVATTDKPADPGNATRKPAEAADSARQAENQPQAPAPRQETTSAQQAVNAEQARNAPAPAPPPASASPQPEAPKPEAQQQAAIHPGHAGAAEGALAQLALTAEPAPASSGTTANESQATNQTATETHAPAAAPEANSPPAPKQGSSRRSAERARAREAAPATTPAPPAAQTTTSQPDHETSAGPPAVQPKSESVAKQTSRRRAERSQPAASAPNPEPGYAQSTGETPGSAQSPADPSARATDKSSRSSRHTATEQRQSWSDNKRKTSKSRRERVEGDDGEPGPGVMVRRYPEEDDGPPFFMTRRSRGEPDRRRSDEEDRPGYMYRESPGFGYREGPPRFGVFDWLFR